MKLSVSCPACGKKFGNIKPELAGKKAKCGCGNVIRLSPKPTPTSDDQDNLMSVDLLGDELLGDQLLGGELSNSNEVPEQKPLGPPSVISPIPKPAKRSRKRAKEPVPEVPIVKSERRKQRNPAASEGPVFAQTYDDLDSILEGSGDAAPIVARPIAPPQTTQPDEPEVSGSKKKSSTFSFLVALFSATLAFWYGLFLVVSRFSRIDQVFFRGFSQAYHSIFGATFENVEVPSGFESMFVGLGWLIWAMGLCLMVFGAAQFINAFYKTMTNTQIFKWSDGLVATFAVGAVFATVAMLLVQYSFQQDRHKYFDDYEKSALGEDGGHLENIVGLRAEMDAQQTDVRNWLLVGAVLSMTIFILSMARLLFKPPDVLESG